MPPALRTLTVTLSRWFLSKKRIGIRQLNIVLSHNDSDAKNSWQLSELFSVVPREWIPANYFQTISNAFYNTWSLKFQNFDIPSPGFSGFQNAAFWSFGR